MPGGAPKFFAEEKYLTSFRTLIQIFFNYREYSILSYSLASIQKVKTVKCIKLSQSEMSEIFISKLVSRTRGEEAREFVYN